MKILPGSPHPIPTAEATETKAAKAATVVRQKSAANSRKGDQVDFSAALTQTLKSQQDLQSERVAAIKAAIKAGTYQVSSRDVAEKMLANSSEL